MEIAVELEEDVLRDLFAAISVGEEAPGDAEDHRLVLADDRGERVAVATLRAAQDLFRLADLGEQSAHVAYIREISENDYAGQAEACPTAGICQARSVGQASACPPLRRRSLRGHCRPRRLWTRLRGHSLPAMAGPARHFLPVRVHLRQIVGVD